MVGRCLLNTKETLGLMPSTTGISWVWWFMHVFPVLKKCGRVLFTVVLCYRMSLKPVWDTGDPV